MTRIIIDFKTGQRLSWTDRPKLKGYENYGDLAFSLASNPWPMQDRTKLDIIAHTWIPEDLAINAPLATEYMDSNIRF